MRPPLRVNPHAIIYACIMIVQGAIWAGPPATFALASNYRVMESIMGEESWAILFLVAGSGWLLSNLTSRLFPRRAGATLGALLLCFVGASFFLSNPQTVNGWVVFLCGIGAALVRWELRT